MVASSKSDRFAPNTITARVYQQIKRDILNGVYPPGAHLVRQTMAKRYGVSSLPILEACYRLEMDGLVENSPQLGVHVIEISEEILEEDRIFREAIECQAARLFARRASADDKERMQELARLMDSIQEKIPSDDPEIRALFQKHHSEFHLAVAKASQSKILYRQMKRLWYRRFMVTGDLHAFLNPVPKNWHLDLIDALNTGDPDHAERQMRIHLNFRSDQFKGTVEELLRRERAELYEALLRGKGDAGDML